MRVGWGVDAHRFGGPGPVRICGVEIEAEQGLLATSDGDVAAHAVADAVLGAAALGDLGQHFPSSDVRWEGADSMAILSTTVALVADHGWAVASVDLTIIAENVRIAPNREAMRERLAKTLGIDLGSTSVKATSTDGMGLIGAGEGMAAIAAVTLRPQF